MTRRARISAWLAGVALVALAVIALRDQSAPESAGPPFPSFASDSVVLPRPAGTVASPGPVTVQPGPNRLRLAWADGVPGGRPVPGAAAFEVRWAGQVRLVPQPAAQLDGLVGQDYSIEVRTVDPFGQRSAPVRVRGTPLNSSPPLSGYADDFDTSDGIHSEVAGSRWHVSAYRGCVDLAAGTSAKKGQLAIQLACGADDVVMRSRAALEIRPDARVTVVTDAAGPRGELTIGFVPGPADRIGSRNRGTAALPAGVIQVSFSDSGVDVITGPSVPRGGTAPPAVAAPKRGTGVLHRFEVALTPSGVRVYQDAVLVGTSDVLLPGPAATVLVGLAGPPGRRSTMYVDAIALSHVVPGPDVVEADAHMGTQRVLRPAENAPAIGMARQPLVGATSARIRTTVTLGAGLDPAGLSLQVGDQLLPLVPATPGPPAVAGTDVTLVAELPPSLFVGDDPPAVSPLVVRGAGTGAVLESYVEITGPARPAGRRPDPELRPPAPAMPVVTVGFPGSVGQTVRSPFVLEIGMDTSFTDQVLPVRGFEVFVEGFRIASVPTDLGGPAAGGRYQLTVALPGQLPGPQSMVVRVYLAGGDPQTSLVEFQLVS